jgi:hypothetical protein
LARRVEDPAEHELSGAPAAVAREELLEGDGLVAFLVGAGSREDAVDAVEQVTAQAAEAPRGPLSELDEVVHEHVGRAHRALEGSVGWWDGGCGSTVRPVIGVAGSLL